MRVFLLNPNVPVDNCNFPMGLAYIAAVLEKEGHDVMAIDANAPYRPYTPEELKGIIRDFKPHFIGITMTVAFITKVYSLSKELLEFGIPLVAGGPHATCLPEEVLSNHFDIVVKGEGEKAVLSLAEYFNGKMQLEQIQGISYKNNGKIVHNPPCDLIRNIDDIPFLSRKHFPLRHYAGSDNPEAAPYFWTMLSSRGCPFNCTFCSSHKVFGTRYRMRSAENIFEEIVLLKERYNAPLINFTDDEIAIDRKRLDKLCDLLIENKLGLILHGRARISSVTEDMLRKMRKAGFRSVSYGIESGDPETLRLIKKAHSIDQIRNGIKVTLKSGIDSFSINNIIGFPWESKSHINNTRALNSLVPKNAKCNFHFCVPIPYPGTEFYDRYYKEFGLHNWWLDESNFEPFLYDNIYRPFFKKHMPFLLPFYLEINFFNYSRTTKKAILKTFVYFGRLANKKLYGYAKEFIINILCRLSLYLYRINPRLERFIFSILLSLKSQKKSR